MKKLSRYVLAAAVMLVPGMVNAQAVIIEAGHYHEDYGGLLFQSVATQLQARASNAGSGLFMYNGGDLSLTDLTQYRAVYFQDNSYFGSYDAQIMSFMAGGGSIGIEAMNNSYNASFFNAILGFDLGAATVGGGDGCYDDESLTADGLAYGLDPANPNIGCYGHGALNMALLPAEYLSLESAGEQFPEMSAMAANVSATPEPASLVLMGTGLLGLAGIARRRKNAK